MKVLQSISISLIDVVIIFMAHAPCKHALVTAVVCSDESRFYITNDNHWLVRIYTLAVVCRELWAPGATAKVNLDALVIWWIPNFEKQK